MDPKKRSPHHPGVLLNEKFLKPMGITQLKFSQHLGWPYPRVNEIIRGKRGITPASALAFSDALGTSPELWLNLWSNFELYQAKKDHKKVKPLRKAS
jgi:antitoxin HigA-1